MEAYHKIRAPLTWGGPNLPALTTIHQPSFDLGAKAAEILIQHLKKKTKLPTTLTLNPQLVVRGSVAGRQEE
ncbi:MAG: substrate-binding domain-containing protein [Desulfobulbaceae bacterium]|nr:substrate-binding domain-containing protein [Desulfobulbaceae bacterium]